MAEWRRCDQGQSGRGLTHYSPALCPSVHHNASPLSLSLSYVSIPRCELLHSLFCSRSLSFSERSVVTLLQSGLLLPLGPANGPKSIPAATSHPKECLEHYKHRQQTHTKGLMGERGGCDVARGFIQGRNNYLNVSVRLQWK